jgi:hypothetical protein
VADLSGIAKKLELCRAAVEGATRGTVAARALTVEILESALAMDLQATAEQVEHLIFQLDVLIDGLAGLATTADQIGEATPTLGTSGPASWPRPHGPGIATADPRQPGALGALFRAGVHDPDEQFRSKERAIAELLAADGASVHARAPDHTRRKVKDPDVIVRRSSQDPGTITEFKTLDRNSSTAVKRCVTTAAKQVNDHGGGDVIIDGRDVDLDEDTAREGYRRSLGEARAHKKVLPHRIFVIMPGDRLLLLNQEGAP